MTSSSSSSYFTSLGDSVHAATLVSTLAFTYMAGRFMNDDANDFFDASWKRDGFCVAHGEVQYWNSHDVCLYVDVAMAAVLGLVYLALHNTPGMEAANTLLFSNIPGILGHGIGHGVVGQKIRELGMADASAAQRDGFLANQTNMELAQGLGFFLVFWAGLLKASMFNIQTKYLIPCVLLAIIGNTLVPGNFGFTYVQTILMVAFSMNQLWRPASEKDYFYATYPLFVGFPLTLVGWMESTQCSKFVKDYMYGHVVYDAYIPIATLTWYLVSYAHVQGISVRKGGKTIKTE
jgi:hypothetical protein